MNELIKKLLENRGVKTKDEIEEFLSDKPKKTYSPFIFKNILPIVLMLLKAFNDKKKILIYADYDVDGITSSTLLYKFFCLFTAKENIDIFIPSRFLSGYGMSIKDLEKIFRENKPDLIITVDLGITCKEEVKFVKDNGVDIIVTDHHEPPNDLPDCLILDPKVSYEKYPFKEICGCGVSFKLAQAIMRVLREAQHLEEKKNTEIFSELALNEMTEIIDTSKNILRSVSIPEIKKTLDNLIELVGVGTVCDIMPLIDENRTFVKYALNKIKRGENYALTTLAKLSDADIAKVNTYMLGFIIGPKLNAVGRLKTAKIASQLLLSNDNKEVYKLSEELTKINLERQKIQDLIFKSVLEEAEKRVDNNESILLLEAKKESEMLKDFDFDLAEGIIGIVASKVKEKFHLPVIIFAYNTENNFLKGSCRSIDTINIIEILRQAEEDFSKENNIEKNIENNNEGNNESNNERSKEELFVSLGGHALAAGLSLRRENLENLRERLLKIIDSLKNDNPNLLKYIPRYDLEILPEELSSQVSLEVIKEIEKLAPFGNGNPKPVFKVKGAKADDLFLMGKDKNHLRFKVSDITFVKFNITEEEINFIKNNLIDIYGSLNINSFNGVDSVQFMVDMILESE